MGAEWPKKREADFPGGPVVEDSPCIARVVGSIPDPGTKISHAAGCHSATVKYLERHNKNPSCCN